jgi:aryl-alcohol dehydrogenase-like predicted oxidoreductase
MSKLTKLDGTHASDYAFGTMQFGGTADESASAAMFAACRDAGITHFDTAYIYTDGASETILGNLAKPERDDLYIATKVAYDGIGETNKLQADFDTSRQRLGMEQVDLLYLHRDPGDDLTEALVWMVGQQYKGTVRRIGLSNFSAWRVMKAQRIAQNLGSKIDALQPMYNLVKRQVEVEILPMCAAENIACVPYSPLGGGLLTGKYVSDGGTTGGGSGRIKDDPRYADRYSLPYMHETASALKDLANELGVSAATLAVAWAAHHPAEPIPILSARSAQQLAPSLAAMSFDMTPELYARISALSPTPPPATDRWEETM